MRINIIVLLAVSCMLHVFESYAQKPLWVQKGTAHLNKQRIEKDYSFVKLSVTRTNDSIIPSDKFLLLKDFISKKYSVNSENIIIDSIVSSVSESVTYKISFPASGKQEMDVLFAQLIDQYSNYDNNIDGSYDYDIFQLFAISEQDVTPTFDNFQISRKYDQLPTLMSLVPGLGQIYKGQTAKGYTIMGVEAALIGSIIYTTTQANRYQRYADSGEGVYSSWESKVHFFKQIRTISAIAGGAVYIYNILDAALGKGAPHVIVKQKAQSRVDLSFHPIISPHSTGFGISMTF